MAFFGSYPAPVGFTGYVQFELSDSDSSVATTSLSTYQVRAEGCDLKLQQEINRPNIVDIGFDRMVYEIQPQVIEGTISYPIVINDVLDNSDPTQRLLRKAIRRNYYGRLETFGVNVKHTHYNASFCYLNCYANTFKFSVMQGDQIRVQVSVMAKDRIESNFFKLIPSNGRVATWNDAIVYIRTPQFSINGSQMRSFEMSVNNNCERYYTASGRILKVRDIAAKARDIEGTIVVLGRNDNLARYAFTNPERCYETSFIDFGYNTTCSVCNTSSSQTSGSTTSGTGQIPPENRAGAAVCGTYRNTFIQTIPNVVFQIEEIALSNDIFETIVKWASFPADTRLGY